MAGKKKKKKKSEYMKRNDESSVASPPPSPRLPSSVPFRNIQFPSSNISNIWNILEIVYIYVRISSVTIRSNRERINIVSNTDSKDDSKEKVQTIRNDYD